MSRKTVEIIFLVFLMAITAGIIGGAMKYALKSFLLPLLVGIPILGLMIFQGLKESFFSKTEQTSPEEKEANWRGGIIACGALVGLILCIYLVGFLISIPLVVFAYIIFSGEKWQLAVGLGLGMFAIVFVLSRILGLYLYEGLLFL